MKDDRRILIAPHPDLFKVSAVVTNFDALPELAAYMCEVSECVGAAGLAAPQIGALVRVVYIAEGDLVMVNPTWRPHDARTTTETERCFSLPESQVRVTRAASIDIEWRDVDGEPHGAIFNDWTARVIQHECDHLDGVTLYRHLTSKSAYKRRTRRHRARRAAK